MSVYSLNFAAVTRNYQIVEVKHNTGTVMK